MSLELFPYAICYFQCTISIFREWDLSQHVPGAYNSLLLAVNNFALLIDHLSFTRNVEYYQNIGTIYKHLVLAQMSVINEFLYVKMKNNEICIQYIFKIVCTSVCTFKKSKQIKSNKSRIQTCCLSVALQLCKRKVA